MALGWKVFGQGMPGPTALALLQDTATAISAAGTTQATATELTAADSEVATVASGSGVILSSKLAPGDEQTVLNSGANPLKIYPTSGMNINQLATNIPMVLPTNTAARFKCLSTTKIMAFMSA